MYLANNSVLVPVWYDVLFSLLPLLWLLFIVVAVVTEKVRGAGWRSALGWGLVCCLVPYAGFAVWLITGLAGRWGSAGDSRAN